MPGARVARRAVAPLALLLASPFVPAATASPRPTASQRVVLAPKFSAGQTMVYQVETRTSTAGKVEGPIDNPESPSQAGFTASLRVRLDVLSVTPAPNGAWQSVHLRATWEASQAQAMTDAVNPAAPDPAAPYAQLEGHSAEFSLSPTGAITELHGLEEIFPGGAPPAAAILWIASLVSSSSFPQAGVAPGQQWTADQPIEGTPLAGVFWHAQSSYLRSEACKSVAGAAAPGSPAPPAAPDPAAQCAAILTHLIIERHAPTHGDATPPDYLRNGLRTSGTWTGSGEGLGSIALSTGLLVSATQTSTQSYDYEIKGASTGTSIRYTGKVDGQTSITLRSLTTDAANAPSPASPAK
jgi:hypothetical protein